ncbi:molecular chaperone [Acinetobacter sp. ANC 4633]|uniref:fimbrial biogenesis chaperone n=1 Tax=Acinetobacter sp. ANC 4633 TaxID=2529845 RepID=UPI00103BCC3A|nr:fimbria/pilus periplasmic chaperone [Acinetobacter sp. ANC 4633]TCB26396.1 molecular chaperone [Acinetobacter sp. ANC 4633]
MKKILWILFMFFLSVEKLWADFSVTPTQLYISNKQQRSTVVTLSLTEGGEKKIFEASAMKWSQNEKGEDVLEPDTNIIINPKNFVIKPNSEQVIRVGFRQLPSLEKEGTWRIFFKEVPPALKANTVQFMMSLSIPLFVGQQKAIDLKAIPRFENNNLLVNIKNNAESHVQITELKILDQKNKEIGVNYDRKYLLTKQENNFKFGQIKSSKDINSYKVLIKTDKSEKPLELQLKE